MTPNALTKEKGKVGTPFDAFCTIDPDEKFANPHGKDKYCVQYTATESFTVVLELAHDLKDAWLNGDALGDSLINSEEYTFLRQNSVLVKKHYEVTKLNRNVHS